MAVNQFVSEMFLIVVKPALLYICFVRIKGCICWRNISINKTFPLKGYCHRHYPNSCDIMCLIGILVTAPAFHIKPFFVCWLACNNRFF